MAISVSINGKTSLSIKSDAWAPLQVSMAATLLDAEVIPAADGSALVLALNQFGHLETLAVDRAGQLDLSSGASLRKLFNDGVANYLAIQWQGDKFYALDGQGYLHVYAAADGIEGYYRSAQPVLAAGQLAGLKSADMVMTADGLLLKGVRRDGSAFQMQAASVLVADQELLALSFELVRTNAAVYLLRDGLLYVSNSPDGTWRPSQFANVSALRAGPAGVATAVEGSDHLLLMRSDGAIERISIPVPNGYIVSGTYSEGRAYALGSDGKLYVRGEQGVSVLTFDKAGLAAGEALSSLTLAGAGAGTETLFYAVSTQGRLLQFSLPQGLAGGAATSAPSLAVLTPVMPGADQRNVSILRDNQGRLVLLQQSDDGSTSYAAFDPASGTTVALVDARSRGFVALGDVERNGVLATQDGRRYALINGQVMYYAYASGAWLPTATTGVQSLQLGADGKLYALLLDSHVASLNEFGFLQNGGEQGVDPLSKEIRYARQSVALPAGVTQFGVSALGALVYLDRDNQLQRVEVVKTEYGAVTVAETTSDTPRVLAVAPADVAGADGHALVTIEQAALEGDGVRGWVLAEGRVFYSDAPNSAGSWREAPAPGGGQRVTGMQSLSDGRVALKLTGGKGGDSVAVFDGSWYIVKAPVTLALPPDMAGGVRSVAVARDGEVYILGSDGTVWAGRAGNWSERPNQGSGAAFQRLQVLADGGIAGRTADGTLLRYQGADGWRELAGPALKPDFDVLYDQLNFARGDFAYSFLVGGGEKATMKSPNLPASVRDEFPSKGTRAAGWANWWRVHFMPTTTRGAHHNDIGQARQELATAWQHLGVLAGVIMPGGEGRAAALARPDIKQAFTAYRKDIDKSLNDALSRLMKELGLVDRNNQTVSDFGASSLFQRMAASFTAATPDSSSNLLQQLYRQRLVLFGSGDAIAGRLRQLIDAGVGLAPGDGPLSALTAKLVLDADSLGLAFAAADAADRAAGAAGAQPDEIARALSEQIAAIDLVRRDSKISQIVKFNMMSLDQADRYIRTLDYLQRGLGDDEHKLQRALSRQGAEQGDIAARYTRMIQSMAVGDTIELKSAWGFKGALGVGIVGLPTGVGASVSATAGGGSEYKMAFEKTDAGIKLKISYAAKGTLGAGVSGSLGYGGITPNGGLSWALASVSAGVDARWEGVWEDAVTLTIGQDDQGSLQRVVDGLLRGAVDPYALLASAEKGELSARQEHVVGVDGSLSAGFLAGGINLAPSTLMNKEGKQVPVAGPVALKGAVFSMKVPVSIVKATLGSERKVAEAGVLSEKTVEKIGLFGSIGIELAGLKTELAASARANGLNGLVPSSQGFTGLSYKRSWDRLNQVQAPRDGYTVEFDDKGVKKISWEVVVDRTGKLFEMDKIKELLALQPALREQLDKLASFTTPANRQRITQKLSQMALAVPVGASAAVAVQLAKLAQYSGFLDADDRKRFGQALDELDKLLPKGATDVAELRSFLDPRYWNNNKPIKITMEATPAALAAARGYDRLNDGDYAEFVNRIAQDSGNVRITAFAVNEARGYKTSGTLGLFFAGYDSSAELSLKHDTASIKLFYSDPPLLNALEQEVRQVARLNLGGVHDPEVLTSMQSKLDAVIDHVSRVLALEHGDASPDAGVGLLADIRALAADSATYDRVDAVLEQLRALVARDHPTANQPNFTYSGERLVKNELLEDVDVSAIDNFVRRGGDELLLDLSGAGAINHSGDPATASRILLASLYANSGAATSTEVDMLVRRVEADLMRRDGVALPSVLDQLRALFAPDPSQGGQDVFDQLSARLKASVSVETLGVLDTLYQRHRTALEELSAADVWQLYRDGAPPAVDLVNGELVYRYRDTSGTDKMVTLSQDMARAVIRSDSERVLYAMSERYTGSLALREVVLSAADIAALRGRPDESGQFLLDRVAAGEDSRYQGIELLGLMEALRSRRAFVERLDPAQRFILTEFFSGSDGKLDRMALLDTLGDSQHFAQFEQAVRQLRAGGGALDTGDLRGRNGRQILEAMVAWDAVLEHGAVGFQKAVHDSTAGLTHRVHFAPQILYLGQADGKVSGECAGLGLAYLQLLAEDDNGGAKNRLLDGVFLYADSAREEAANLTPSSTEAAQSADFRAVISRLQGDAGGAALDDSGVLRAQGRMTLAALVAALKDAPGDCSYQLGSGNHAMVLARKSVDGALVFYFYDPNFGDVELRATSAGQGAAALGAIIERHLGQQGTQWAVTGGDRLADFYAVARSGDGQLLFDVSQFNAIPAQQLPAAGAFGQLHTLLVDGRYVTERERLAALPKVRLDGVDIAPLQLYDMGATIDGVRLSAAMDPVQAAAAGKLRFLGATLATYLASADGAADATAAVQLLKRRLLQGEAAQQRLLIADSGQSMAGAEAMLDSINARVSSTLEVDPALWAGLQAKAVVAPADGPVAEASGALGSGLRAFSYYQAAIGLMNYLRRSNVSGMRDQQAEQDLAINLASIAYDLVQDAIGSGVARFGVALADAYHGASSVLGRAAASIGRGLAKAGAAVTGMMSAGFDLYSVITSFDKLDSARTPEERQDLIVNGSLSVVGAVVGVATVVAMALGGALAAAAGPVGLVAGALLALGGAIYSAVRQVQEVERHIELSPLERLTLGWTSFWGFGLDAATALRVETAVVREQAQAGRDQEIQRFVKEVLATSADKQGYDEVFYGNGAVQVGQYYYYSIMVDGVVKQEQVRREELTQRLDYWAGTGAKVSYKEAIYDSQYAAFAGIADTNDMLDLRDGQQGATVVHQTAATVAKDKIAFINLGGGDDTAYGYQDKRNLFTVGAGSKQFSGGSKDDVFLLQARAANGVRDVLDGAGGNDTLVIVGRPVAFLPGGTASSGYVVDLSLASATVRLRSSDPYPGAELATLRGIENVVGDKNSDDVLRGGAGANVLDGAGGADRLYGGGGADQLILREATYAEGGSGADTYVVKRKLATRSGQAIVEAVLRDEEGELGSLVLEYDLAEVLREAPVLDGNDVLLRLATSDGGVMQASMTLRIKDAYADADHGGKRLRNQLVLLTRDGFVLSTAWAATLAEPSAFTPTMRAAYSLVNDQLFAEASRDYLSRFNLTLAPPGLEIGRDVQGDFKGQWSISIHGTTTRTVKLPNYVSIATEGGAGADTLRGDAGGNILRGYAGDDYLSGGGGNDIYVVSGDIGEITRNGLPVADYRYTDSGDKVIDNGAPMVAGGTGYAMDYLQVGLPRDQLALRQDGADVVLYFVSDQTRAARIRLKDFMADEGHRHLTLIDASGASYALGLVDGVATLSDWGGLAGDADGAPSDDTLVAPMGQARLSGGQGNDLLLARGTRAGDILAGEDGDDVLRDSAFDDTLDGGAGNDVLLVGRGALDLVLTGAGSDELRLARDASGVKVVDVGPDDGKTDTVWMPVALSALRYARQDDSLVLQGQSADAAAGERLTVVLKDYFKDSGRRHVVLKSYEGASLAGDPAALGTMLNQPRSEGRYVSAESILGGLRALTLTERFRADQALPSSGDYVPLFSYAGGTGSDFNRKTFLVSVSASGLSVWLRGVEYGGSGIGAAELLDQRSHTVSVSWDSVSGLLSVSVDGVLRKTWSDAQTGQALPEGEGVVVLGQASDAVQANAAQAGYHNFRGVLEAVQLHDRVLSDAEIARISQDGLIGMSDAQRGMLAWWSFGTLDAGGERPLSDLSGNHALAYVATAGSSSSRSAPALTAREVLDSDALWQRAQLASLFGSAAPQQTAAAVAGDGDDMLVLTPASYGDYVRVGAGWQWSGATDAASFSSGAGDDSIVDFDDVSAGISADSRVRHVLDGGAGDDAIDGGSGIDWLSGGAGNDVLLGGDGDDVLDGGSGDDRLEDYQGVNRLLGGAGDDAIGGRGTLYGGSGSDRLAGSEADDVLYAEGPDQADTGSDLNLLAGLGGNDQMFGGAGNDEFDGGEGDDQIDGGAGDDVFWVSAGKDRVAGGAGLDLLSFARVSGAVTFNGSTGAVGGAASLAGLSAVEAVEGSAFDDVMSAGGEVGTLYGGAGADTLTAAGGGLVVASLLPGWGRDAQGMGLMPPRFADVNGDTVLDAIALDGGARVATGLTAGGYGAPAVFASGGFDTRSALLADLDGDGRADLYDPSSGKVAQALGTGGFGVVHSVNSAPPRLHLDGLQYADFNRDGVLDELAIYTVGARASASDYSLLRLGQRGAAGAWSLGTAVTLSGVSGNAEQSVDNPHTLIGDIDGDGIVDAVILDDGGVQWARGQLSNSSFSFAPSVGIGMKEFTAATGWQGNQSDFAYSDSERRLLSDVNGDGCADLVGFKNGQVQVAYGSSAGGLLAPTTVLSFDEAVYAGYGVADLNRDGRPDYLFWGRDGVYASSALAAPVKLSGGSGDDRLNGAAGADTLVGGTGADIMAGGGGDDLYVYVRGDGDDIINEAGGSDTLRIDGGNAGPVGAEMLWLRRRGNDLHVLLAGTDAGDGADGDILVQDYFAGKAHQMETLQAGGRQLVGSNIDLLVTAMAGQADFDFGAAGVGGTVRQEMERLWLAVGT